MIITLMKRMLLAVFVILFLTASVKCTRNYMGYCAETGEILNDEELIEIGVKKVLLYYPRALIMAEKVNDELIYYQRRQIPQKPILYESVEHFMKVNKNCCSVTLGTTDKIDSEVLFYRSTIERLFSTYQHYVRVRYLVNYLDADDELISQKRQWFIPINNCGIPI